MQSGGIAKQIARWVALGALFLIPLAPLLVANTYFFPFITGKAFYFRILVELAVAAWVVLALLDREYRPRFSWIGAVVAAFVVWMFIADAFAPNAAKAFWSNFERMEGWVLLIHLLGFFYAAGAVLRVEKKWRAWFLTSLGVSVVIVGYAFMQLAGMTAIHQGSARIDASLGNSAYLAIYFLFNVFIALWLALTEKLPWLKWSLIALAVLEAVLIFFTETRGTIIGLVLALALAALLTALTAGKSVRRWAWPTFAFIVIFTGSFYLIGNSASIIQRNPTSNSILVSLAKDIQANKTLAGIARAIQANPTLARIASISLADGQTRFTIWHMALQGTMERPIVGWGQEGFNYVFNKYYDPSLHNQEPWFDRAHNASIDWLTAGGVPAFLLYLSLFGSALVLLWKSSELSRPERIALTAALAGYAVHNFFVFDNLYSYVYFFAILALIDSQIGRPIERLERAPGLSAEDGVTYALPIATVVAFALIWYVNMSGMQVATKLITAISPSSAGVTANISAFEDLAAHPSFAAQEIREQLVSFASSALQSPQVTDENKRKILSLAVTEMQKQVDAYPLDARERLQLSYVYRSAGDTANALKEIQAAGVLSPGKEDIWIQAGATEWDMGDFKAMQADFNKAYALGPQFKDLAEYAAAGDIVAGDTAAADKILLATFGTTSIDSNIIAVAYYRTKDWPHLIGMWKARANAPGAPVESWFSLAAAYYAAGDNANAIKTINTATTLFPSAASSGAAAIQQIQGKK